MKASFKDGEQKQSVGTLPIIIGIGSVAALGYFAFDYFDKAREQAAIDEANKNIASSEANRVRQAQKLAVIENKAIVSGRNAWGKDTTVNITDQSKQLIDALLNVYTAVNTGLKKYSLKSESDLNGQKALNTMYETPLKEINKLKMIYAIYTQRDLVSDLQKLPVNTYAKIKALLDVAAKQKQSR